MALDGQKLHYEGVLEKAGKRFFEGFRRRWFILDGKNLSYYKASETTPENLLGIIDLTKVKAVVPFKMINNNAFQIITSMRTYTFTAATPQLMTEWISVLRQAMQIESFNNKRGKASVRASSKDDSGYEVVSGRNRSGSDQATNDDDLYDQVTGTSQSNVPIGTYGSVGEQPMDYYDTVSPSPVKTDPPTNVPEIGSYGIVGEHPRVNTPSAPEMYATVQKKRSVSEEVTGGAEIEAMYAEVGAEPKQSKPEVIPMAIICESDEEDEEEEEIDEVLVNGNLESINDPLPPPKGDNYAVDQIKLLLKDFKSDHNVKMNQEYRFEDITENNVVPESSEIAFQRLREFLNKLETK